ncbi:MAG: N-acetylmuramoyl-L-alanine amidase, partial [Ferruginibacter sp.]
KAGYFTRILALPVILFLAAAFTLKTKKIMEPLFNNSKQITVVIDAGHGGNDAGAISPSGLVEKELNLLLAKKIKDLNINDNIKIILTRQSDLTQSPQDKVAIAAQSGADLFISIHLNNGPKDSENKNTGLEVYVAKDEYPLSNKSKLFATAVIYAFSDNYKLPVLANPLQRKTGIWILQSNVCPSVIIEAGYLNNVSDMAYLQTESGKETFAKNVLAALNNYFSQTEIGLTSSTEVMNALSQLRPTTHLTKDTIPKLIKNNEVILIDNVEMVIKRDGEKQELSVIVIDDKIYNYEEIKNKTIIAKRARLYGKNNKEMIDLYGLQARDGAMVFEDAIITDNLSGIYTNALKDVKNNPYVDASERINGKSQRIIFESNELIIQDGKEITKKEMGAIDKNRIRTINVYKEKQAIEKFGNKGRNGVLEIATIDTLIKPASQKPYITLSGISGPRIHIDQLKNIKELTLSSPEYRIIRGTAFFAGAGFPNVNTADFAGSSLIPLQTLLNRILPGTSVTFDNIQIEQKDGKGRMTINGKSFGFYKNESDIIMNNDDKIFTEVEVDPQFPGGISGWQNYLKTHINPMLPVDEGWKAGTYQITVLFIVDKDGNISDVNTKDFTNSKTALHCIDLIKKGPRWIPAKQNGVSVKAYKKQPITFVVSEG